MNQPLIPEVELSRLRAEQSTLSTDIPTLITSLEDARATRERIIARATEL